jgi:uncharacterized protein
VTLLAQAHARAKVQLRWDVKIPVRDGLNLSATVYLPEEPRAPSACILTLTPYSADIGHERGMFFAAKGYPFVCVDVRGRGNSEGEFRPFIQESRDGYDVVEWLAMQPYCNGKVAMIGGSYGGYAQWVAAKELPPHLATIIPTASPYMGVDFPMRSNIFYPYLAQWLTYTSGRASQSTTFYDREFWSTRYRDWHRSGRPFRELAGLCGSRAAVFREWLSHPQPDAYWDAYNPTDAEYERIQIPILTITGTYDDDQPGALEHYRRHVRHAPPQISENHYLVIGPWDHQGTSAPTAAFGGLTFGAASVVDLAQLRLEWYDWILRGGPRPSFLQKRVAYYVMGDERWRYAETLDAVTAGYTPLFLGSHGNANDVFASGWLSEEPRIGPADIYTYDPREDGPEVEAEARTAGGSLADQSVVLALHRRQLIYHSAPLAADVEISGFFELSAWVSIDCPDTDIYVSVHEIDREGQSIRLTTDALRARYREGPRVPRVITTQEPLECRFHGFTFVSRQVRRGHRLRLVISPIGRLVESIFAEKNYNGGGTVAEESLEQGRPVTLRLYHDDTHCSVLRVPLGQLTEPSDPAMINPTPGDAEP